MRRKFDLEKEVIDKYHGLTQIEDQFRVMDTDDPNLKLILDAFGIDIPAKLYHWAELKSIKSSIKIFTQACSVGMYSQNFLRSVNTEKL